jgi:hypothetical protein
MKKEKLFATKNPKEVGSLPVDSIIAICKKDSNEVIGYVFTGREHTYRRVHQGSNSWNVSISILEEGYDFIDPTSKSEEDLMVLQWAAKRPKAECIIFAPMWGGVREKKALFYRENSFSSVEWVEFYIRPAKFNEICNLFSTLGENPFEFRWGTGVSSIKDILLNGKINYFCRDGKVFLIEQVFYPDHVWLWTAEKGWSSIILKEEHLGLSPEDKVNLVVNNKLDLFEDQGTAPKKRQFRKKPRTDSGLTPEEAVRIFLPEEEEA